MASNPTIRATGEMATTAVGDGVSGLAKWGRQSGDSSSAGGAGDGRGGGGGGNRSAAVGSGAVGVFPRGRRAQLAGGGIEGGAVATSGEVEAGALNVFDDEVYELSKGLRSSVWCLSVVGAPHSEGLQHGGGVL